MSVILDTLIGSKQVLEYLRYNEQITVKIAAIQTNMSSQKTWRLLESMKKAELLDRESVMNEKKTIKYIYTLKSE